MSTISRRIFLHLGAAALVVSSDPVFAGDWPSRPVKIVAPFSPGGTADIFARVLAEHLGVAFKQPFYVESRPGAGGMIGSRIGKAGGSPFSGSWVRMATNCPNNSFLTLAHSTLR